MEKKIDRIYRARDRRCKFNKKSIILFGVYFHGAGIICGILGAPWFFISWLYGRIKERFCPKEFDKEKFRKWFEKPRNFKHFIFFWDEKNFSITTSTLYGSHFANNLKKWWRFTKEAAEYLAEEYEIEGYRKEVADGIEPCIQDIDFYIKDNQ